MTPPLDVTPLRHAIRILLALLLTAFLAREAIPVPGSPVPQSLQTVAVIFAAIWLGPLDATIAMIAYLVLGGLGVPLFSGGEAGWQVVTGPSGGYLVGFIAAAWIAGRLAGAAHPSGVDWRRVFVASLGAHAVILSAGWSWLAVLIGTHAAWDQGVAPFLWGAVVKSILLTLIAAAIVTLVRRRGYG